MQIPHELLVGLLLSGGVDSTILLTKLLARGKNVQPFYVQSGLTWQSAERAAVGKLLDHYAGPQLRPLVVLEQPLADLLPGHWGVGDQPPPDAQSRDEEVFLPGRNLLLILKPALWCQLHGVPCLALATLGTSPFSDASLGFFRRFEQLLHDSLPPRAAEARSHARQPGQAEPAAGVRLCLPFHAMNKQQVMQLADNVPLGLSFSCLAPRGGIHCGTCNKCAERQQGFRASGANDPTPYAVPPHA